MSAFSSVPHLLGRTSPSALSRRIIPLLGLLGAGFTVSAPAHAADAKDQLLVRTSVLSPSLPAPGVATTQNLVQASVAIQSQLSVKLAGAKLLKNFDQVGWALVDVPQGVSSAEAFNRLQASLGADNVQTNHRVKTTSTPNDDFYSGQYWLGKISAPAAWDITTGSNSVVVAVIDSGAQLNHPDLVNNLWVNPQETPGNGKDDDDNGYIDDVNGITSVPGEENLPPSDDRGHGTFCASVIGAQTNNSLGVAGINWNVKVMPLRFVGPDNSYISAAVECFNYLIKLKRRGVNIRATSNAYSSVLADGTPSNDPALETAFQQAGALGIVNVVAAGNDSLNLDSSARYPASYADPSVITVAASDANDNPTSTTNTGVNSVELAAPGARILGLNIGSSAAYYSGTSAAAPMVAGAVALLQAKQSGLSAAQVKERILKSVDRIESWRGKTLTGGRLNLFRMLNNETNDFATISGQVYRTAASVRLPLPNAKVTIAGKTSVTDSNGNYKIENIKPGTYKVTPKLAGFKFTAQSLFLPSQSGGLIADFEGIRQGKSYYITGTAVDSTSKGIPNVEIFQNTNKGPARIAVTGEDGKYVAVDLKGGTYRLTAKSVSNPELILVPNPEAVKLPTKSGGIAPNAVVNFGLVFGTGPAVTITSPANDMEIVRGTATDITINAKDDNGVDEVSYTLTYINNGKTTYYNWKNKNFTSNSTDDNITAVEDVEGTDVTFTVKLPKAKEGRYIFTAWGRDNLGNVTDPGVTGDPNRPSKRPRRILDVIIDNNSVKSSE